MIMWHASTHCMLARHLSHWESCILLYLLLNPFYCFHHFRWTSVEHRIGLCRGTSGPSSRPSWPIPMMTPPPKLGSETVGHAPYATFCKHVIIIKLIISRLCTKVLFCRLLLLLWTTFLKLYTVMVVFIIVFLLFLLFGDYFCTIQVCVMTRAVLNQLSAGALSQI